MRITQVMQIILLGIPRVRAKSRLRQNAPQARETDRLVFVALCTRVEDR